MSDAMLSDEERAGLIDILRTAPSTLTAEPILRDDDDTVRDVFKRLEPHVAALVAAAGREGEERGARAERERIAAIVMDRADAAPHREFNAGIYRIIAQEIRSAPAMGPRGESSAGVTPTQTETVRRRLARKLRAFADRIDPDGASRRTHLSFTFEDRQGIVIHMFGDRGCPLWYYGMADYERAHTESETLGAGLVTGSETGRPE